MHLIHQHQSPNCGSRRGGLVPQFVILHYTAMASADAAISYLCDPQAEVSAHYVISKSGQITQLVGEGQRAWHAGAGEWQGLDDMNSRSIGIELDNDGESPMPADTTSDVTSTRTADDTSEAAVLYAIDLGENGMTMVVSTKTSLRPGDCAAMERSGTYFNLRGVNAGFCDPTNQAIITALRSVNLAAAQRCKLAREQEKVLADDENQPITPSNLGILCDGS